jgi:hypothetical protein
MSHRLPALLLALGCCAACVAVPGAQAASDQPRDPVVDVLNRIDAFLHRGEVDGVTPDPRNLQNPPEQIRLSVVPQLLAYCELYRVHPSTAHHDDIVARADFLVGHLDTITSGTASDGLLGYALLSAYEITGDLRYWTPADTIVRRALELRGFGLKLNWGLMSALALAKYHQLGGDPLALTKAVEIVRGVALSQSADGGLPHLCAGTRDVHYTAWMSMELIQLYTLTSDPLIPKMLMGTYSFMQGRVEADGVTRYEDPPELTSAGSSYYGPVNGCRGDYDTRGWVNELGYNAILFDHFADARYGAVMERLLQLEDHGAFPDKWGYFPDLDDPIYPWAGATRSVIRTSLVFWSLAAMYSDRETRGQARILGAQLAAATPEQGVEAGEPVPPLALPGSGFPFSPTGIFLGEAVPDTMPTSPPTAGQSSAEVSSAEGQALSGSAPPSEAAQEQSMSLALPGPDPARGTAVVRFSLAMRDQASLRVYDVAGKAVRELWRGAAGPGAQQVVWDGRDDAGSPAPSGLYFVRLATRGSARSTRLLWLR